VPCTVQRKNGINNLLYGRPKYYTQKEVFNIIYSDNIKGEIN